MSLVNTPAAATVTVLCMHFQSIPVTVTVSVTVTVCSFMWSCAKFKSSRPLILLVCGGTASGSGSDVRGERCWLMGWIVAAVMVSR